MSAPKTEILSASQSRTSAAICERMVSQPVPMSAAPIIILYVPSSESFNVHEPTSTFEMHDPCIASAIPAALTLPFPISLTGYFSAQLKFAAQCSIHLSKAQAFAVSPKYAGMNIPSLTMFFILISTGSI